MLNGILQVILFLAVPFAMFYIFKFDIDFKSQCRLAIIVLGTVIAVFAMIRLISGFFLEYTDIGTLTMLERMAANQIIAERWELLGFMLFGVVIASSAWLQIRAEQCTEESDSAR